MFQDKIVEKGSLPSAGWSQQVMIPSTCSSASMKNNNLGERWGPKVKDPPHYNETWDNLPYLSTSYHSVYPFPQHHDSWATQDQNSATQHMRGVNNVRLSEWGQKSAPLPTFPLSIKVWPACLSPCILHPLLINHFLPLSLPLAKFFLCRDIKNLSSLGPPLPQDTSCNFIKAREKPFEW